jgi:hypothetical protein
VQPFAALDVKMLNSIEDAHLESMSTFDADEHLRSACGLRTDSISQTPLLLVRG